MKPSEYFDCDTAQDILEERCDGMPDEFQVVKTGWCQADDTYYAIWEARGGSARDYLARDPESLDKSVAIKKVNSVKGATAVWFNQTDDDGLSPACKILSGSDLYHAQQKKIIVLDQI